MGSVELDRDCHQMNVVATRIKLASICYLIYLVATVCEYYHACPAACSSFLSTSATVLSVSAAIEACFCIDSRLNWLHRSPSTTALTGA